MITKWASFEEYSKWVEPLYLRKGLYTTRASQSLLRQICRMEADIQSLWHVTEQLRDSGYDGRTRKPKLDSSNADKHYAYVRGLCVHLLQLGESIFVTNKSLAKSPQGMDFLDLRDLQTDWDSYKNSGGIDQRINELLGEAERLSAAYYDTINDSDEFLIAQFSEDFPVFLRRDFDVARDQFSVGLQETGFLSAGRGLEGVLRAFAQKKGIWIDRKGSSTPVVTLTSSISLKYWPKCGGGGTNDLSLTQRQKRCFTIYARHGTLPPTRTRIRRRRTGGNLRSLLQATPIDCGNWRSDDMRV
jgi:hypothetical protein